MKKPMEDEVQLLHGGNSEDVRTHSNARCHASSDLCMVFEGYPQPEVTNT
jgi:hypothetical protein